MRLAILGVALVVVSVLLIGSQAGSTPPIAEASFHEIRIYKVMGGANGDPGVQFVELRLAAGSQNAVGGKQVCFFDEAGDPWARFVFPSGVTIGTSQSSILIGSTAMASEWDAGGAQVDFEFSAANTTALNGSADVLAPIRVPAGKIAYGSGGSCDAFSILVDSLAYGTSYTGTANFGTKFNQDLPQDDSQGFQLTPDPVAHPATDNSTEYALVGGCMGARNNAGATGIVGCGVTTPTPSPEPTDAPTATPTDAPTATVIVDTIPPSTPGTSVGPQQGDADCDGDVDEDDGIDVLEEVADINDVECPVQADVTCDGVDAFDALAIFKYLTNLSNFCLP